MTTTTYVEIIAAHSPATTGMVDVNARTVWFCNFDARVNVGAEDLESDIAEVIHDAGYGTLSTDLFLGPNAVIPPDSGPYITVIAANGYATEQTQQDYRIERPSFQVTVRSTDGNLAQQRMMQIFRLLDGLRSRSV